MQHAKLTIIHDSNRKKRKTDRWTDRTTERGWPVERMSAGRHAKARRAPWAAFASTMQAERGLEGRAKSTHACCMHMRSKEKEMITKERKEGRWTDRRKKKEERRRRKKKKKERKMMPSPYSPTPRYVQDAKSSAIYDSKRR